MVKTKLDDILKDLCKDRDSIVSEQKDIDEKEKQMQEFKKVIKFIDPLQFLFD